MANVISGLQSVITMRLFIAWRRDEFAHRQANRAFAFMPRAQSLARRRLHADREDHPRRGA
jgi:hypothetical protein